MAEHAATTGLRRSTCPYCGVGCGVLIETDGRRLLGVRGDPAHPSNRGRLCTKGSTLHLTGGAQGRLLHPSLRRDRAGPHVRVGWDEIIALLAERYAGILARRGPDALGFYLSGQLLTEDYHVFNRLVRALIGSNNIDTNSRLCMSSAVSAYKATLGADAPPACYDDIEQADLILIAGANPAWAHPILFRRLEAAKRANPALRVVCIDPRRTASAESADLHLAVQPGSDVALFNGLMHLLLWNDAVDRDYVARHTAGFDALKRAVRDYPPRFVAETCGIAQADLERLAQWIGAARAMLSLYCQGLNQSTQGTAKNATLINPHLATGQIGRPGAGPLSLTGQPNAMGGRETGGMATLLPGHRDPANAADRAELAALWGVPSLPARPGLTAVELFEAAARGEIAALWIACTNPAHSLPDQALVRAALARAELVVVQEAYAGTDTAHYADVLLPAATWGEKDGTMTNAERRLSRVAAAVPPPGEARPDWAIALAFARALDARLRPGQPGLFGAETPAALFAEHAAATRGRDLDYGAVSHARLDAEGPLQWPCASATAPGTPRLYADGRYAHADGRARFFVADWQPPAHAPNARHPLLLNTGRLRDHWHGMSRSGRVPGLHGHAPSPTIDVHPAELARRGLRAGELVRVRSALGSVVLPLRADDGLVPAQAFVAMHWSGRSLNHAGCNLLVPRALDPCSRQAELKATPIRIEPVDLPWRLLALRALTDGADADTLDEMRDLLGGFDYAHCGYDGHAQPAVVLRAACATPPAAALLARLDALLALDAEPATLRYEDARRGSLRLVRLRAGRVAALRTSGPDGDRSWLARALVDGEDLSALGPRVLAPDDPRGARAADPPVCACTGIGRRRIEETLDALAAPSALALDALKRSLGCGAQCGSCVPELQRIVARHRASPAAEAADVAAR
ncbi:MAG: molybdopterin-dependent oxidoreductase [Gammaproteobacteria bacterium]